MPVETDWTVHTLKEHFSQALNDFKDKWAQVRDADDLRYQQRFDAQQKAVVDALLAAEKAVNAALASADRAVVKAETAAEKRFESVNEFRAVLSNQSASLMPRTEADAQFRSMSEKIDDIKTRIDRGEGNSQGARGERADANMTIGSVMGIIGGIVAVLGLFATIALVIIESPRASPPTVVSPAVIPVVPK